MKSLQKSVSIDRDLELRYLDRGRHDAVPVIFLPGYSDSCVSYLPLMRKFPSSYRLIALSQRGHGDSDKPDDGYETRRFSDDLAGFLNALEIPRAVVVGHSFGTLVAMRFAIDYPARVLALGLLGGFSTLAGNPGMDELWSEVSQASDQVDPEFVRAFQESTLARPIPAERLESAIEESQKIPGRVWKALARHLLDEDFSDDIARITAPALVVWGEEDQFTAREEQEFLVSRIRNSELVAVPGAGHAIHWESPTDTARMLTDFFAERIDAAA